MDTFMKKIRQKQVPLDDSCDATAVPPELVLEDDPFFFSGFAGKLTFASGDSDSNKDVLVAGKVPYEGSQNDTSSVTFEVTSAEIIRDMPSTSILPGHTSHVDYTIMVCSNTGMKDVTTCIVHRYSDFEHLHRLLKKRFSNLISAVVFPHKVLVGNFSSEIIAKRSRAFEQYLTHLYSILEVRYSSEFTKFFTGDDYAEAMQAFTEGKYLHSVTLLERYLPVMEKLYGNSHSRIGQTVCALVVSHMRLNHGDVADTYATLAMNSLPESPLTVPLLQALARLRWSQGREKKDVEEKLQELKDKGLNMALTQDLEEVLCKQLNLKSHTVTS